MTGFILAAGLGTRLRPLTDKIPKPAVPFLNVPLILFSHHLMTELGIKRAVVNTHHFAHRITNLFQQLPPTGLTVVFSEEQPKVLGTGGALKNAAELIGKTEPVFLVNADSLFMDLDVQAVRATLEDFPNQPAISVVFSCEHKEVGTRFGGVWQNAKGEILGLGKERPLGTMRGTHYLGLQILDPEILGILPDGVSDLWKDGLNIAISRGKKVLNVDIQADWYETGDAISFLDATRIALTKIVTGDTENFLCRVLSHYTPNFNARSKPLRGLNLALDPSSLVSDYFMLGDRVAVGSNSNLQGFGVIGENSKIGSDCVIENSVVLPNSVVLDGTIIQNTIHCP